MGVSVGQQHRAYAVAKMSDSTTHVINDFIDNTPVTVAYCDRTSCTRAFTASGRTSPLELSVGGWMNEGEVSDMLLRDGRHRYQMKTGQAWNPDTPPFPYENVAVVLTTWGEWRSAHPDTDLILGGRPNQSVRRN